MTLHTFHIMGIPFTSTSRKYPGDAMTQNVFNLCCLLTRMGHRVYHYGNHGSDMECTEHVEILTASEMEALYSGGADIRLAANGYYAKGASDLYRTFMERVTLRLAERKGPDEFLLGVRYPHPEATRTHGDLIYVHHSVGHMEPGPPATIFASEYIRNLTLGVRLAQTKQLFNEPQSAVIPHFVFDEEFELCLEPDDYFLFLGRLSSEKGLDSAIKVCAQTGQRLVIAGQGDISGYGPLPPGCEYLGYVDDVKRRNSLLRKATALFMPSRYEAFGLAAIEA